MAHSMHRLLLPLVCVAALGLALPALGANTTAAATHYRWKDASGVVHFSDTIPSSALAGGYDIVNNSGLVIRHVARELTPAERKAAAAEAARLAAAKRARQQQSMDDAQLLSAYPTEHDLAESQQAQLNQMRLDIRTLETNLQSQESNLTDLLSHAADLEHAGKPVPPDVTRRIAEQRATVNSERQAVAGRRNDFAQASARFSAQLAHYRTLRAQYDTTPDP